MVGDDDRESVEALLRLARAQDDAILALVADVDTLATAIWIISSAIDKGDRDRLKSLIIGISGRNPDIHTPMLLAMRFIDDADTVLSEYAKLLNRSDREDGVVGSSSGFDA